MVVVAMVMMWHGIGVTVCRGSLKYSISKKKKKVQIVDTQMLKPPIPRAHCRHHPGMVWHGCGCSVMFL